MLNEDSIDLSFDENEGNLAVFAGSVNLEISNQFAIQGEFALRKTNFGNDPGFEVIASNVTATLTAGDNVVGVQNGTLAAQLYANGTVALDVSGGLLLTIGDFVDAQVDFASFKFNNTGLSINQTVTIGNVSANLSVLAGTVESPYARVSLENFSVRVGDVQIVGTVAVERSVDQLIFAFTDVTPSFGAQFDSLIQLSNGQGIIVVDAAGVAGSIQVDLESTVGNVVFQGNFAVTFNTGTSAVSKTLQLDSGQVVQLDVAAGPIARLEGSDVSLTALGVTLSGDIIIEAVDNGMDSYLAVQIANAELLGFALFADSSVLDVTGLTVAAVLFQDGIVVDTALSLSSDIGLLSASADLRLQINTTDRDVAIAGFFNDETVNAGPAVRVVARDFTLDIGGVVQLQGDFWYEQQLDQPAQSLKAENVSVFIGDVDNQVGFALTNGFGEIVSVGGEIQLATLSVSASLVGFTDVTFAADLDLSITIENESYVTRLTATDIVLSVAEVFSIGGDLFVEYDNDRLTLGIANGELFVGTGSLADQTAAGFLLSDVTFGMILLVDSGTYVAEASGVASIVGIADLSLNGSLLFRTNTTEQTFTDETITVDETDVILNFTEQEKDGYLTLSGNIDLVVADALVIKGDIAFKLYADVVEVLATVEEASLSLGGFKVGLENADLVMFIDYDGTVALSISGGSFVLEGADLAASLINSITLEFNNTYYDLSSDTGTPYEINIDGNTGTLDLPYGDEDNPYFKVLANMELDIGGIGTLSGDFAFEKIETDDGDSALAISFTGAPVDAITLNNSLQDYVTLSNPQAVLLITSAGVAGEVSVETSFDFDGLLPSSSLLSSIDLTGNFKLIFNTGSDAVEETFTANEVSYEFDILAGTYVALEGTGVTLTFGADDPNALGLTSVPTISGDISIGAYANGDVFLSLSGVSLDGFGSSDSSGDVISIDDISGTLNFVSGAGIVGGLSFSGIGSGLIEQFQVAKVELFINTNDTATTTVLGGVREVTLQPGFSLFLSGFSIELGPVEVTGDFSIQSSGGFTVGGVSQTGNIVTGSNIEIFMGTGSGENRVGFLMTGGVGSLIQQGGLEAGEITGLVSVVGIDGLELSSELTFRFNEFDGSLEATVQLTPEVSEDYSFTTDESGGFYQFEALDTRFAVGGGAVDFRGDFGVTITSSPEGGTLIKLGLVDGRAFIGSQGALLENDQIKEDAFGLLVENLEFGLVVDESGKVAAEGSGDTLLKALPGLSVTGDFSLRINNTGGVVNETVTVNNQNIRVRFNAGEENLQRFEGNVFLSLPNGIFGIQGTLLIENTENGLSMDFSDPSVVIKDASGEELFSGGIDLDFTLDETNGLVADTSDEDVQDDVALLGGAPSTDSNIVDLGPLQLENPTFDITNLSFNTSLEFGFSLEVGVENISLPDSDIDFSIKDSLGVLDLVIGFDFAGPVPEISPRVAGFSFTHGAFIAEIEDVSVGASAGGFAVDFENDVFDFYVTGIEAFLGTVDEEEVVTRSFADILLEAYVTGGFFAFLEVLRENGGDETETVYTRKGVAISEGNLGLSIFFGDENPGFALEVSGDASILGIEGVSIDGSIAFAFNNTGVDVNRTFRSTVDTEFTLNVVAGLSRFGGSVTVGVQDNEFEVGAVFQKTDNTIEILIDPIRYTQFTGEGSSRAEVFTVSGSGAFYVDLDAGFVAAAVSLTLDTSGSSISGFSIDGTATLQFNTGDVAISVIAGQELDREISANSFAIFVEGSLTIQSFSIEGSFGFAVREGDVEIAASITRIDLGSLVIDQTIAGAMVLTPDGVAFQISIDFGNPGLDVGFFAISGVSTLRVNTTDRAFAEIAGQSVQLTANIFALRVGFVKVDFGGFIVITAEDTSFDFTAGEGENLVEFGEVTARFDGAFAWLNNIKLIAGNFGIRSDFELVLLDGFFIGLKAGEAIGFDLQILQFSISELVIEFNPGAIENGRLVDASNFTLVVTASVGLSIELPDSITVAIFGGATLRIDVGDFANQRFNLDTVEVLGLSFGITVDISAIRITGEVGFGTVEVNKGTLENPNIVRSLYMRVRGQFFLEGIGGGIELIFSDRGPILASISAGGFVDPTSGFVFTLLGGGILFGGEGLPDVEDPKDLVTNPAYENPLQISDAQIRETLEDLIRRDATTFTAPITLAASVEVTNIYVAGLISVEGTLAANIGFDPDGSFNFKLLISGRFQVFGLNVGEGAILLDLSNPLAPRLDFAIAIGGDISPLAKLLPVSVLAVGTFEMEFLIADLLNDVKDVLSGQGTKSHEENTAELNSLLAVTRGDISRYFSFRFFLRAEVAINFFGIPAI